MGPSVSILVEDGYLYVGGKLQGLIEDGEPYKKAAELERRVRATPVLDEFARHAQRYFELADREETIPVELFVTFCDAARVVGVEIPESVSSQNGRNDEEASKPARIGRPRKQLLDDV